MIDAIRSFFYKELTPAAEEAPARGHDPIHVAACALLLEIGHADGTYGERERQHLLRTLEQRFLLDAEVLQELETLALTERRGSVDLWQFTTLLAKEYGPADKERLIEGLWRIVYADGSMSRDEQYLMRKITQLLDVAPAVVHAIQKRVHPHGPR